jgi:hypothetical protein
MTAAAPAERPPSVWEDLLEIFYAPRAVFERRRETPAFGLALLVFVVLIVALSFAFRGLMEPVFDAEFKRGMAQAMKQNPQLTEAQMMQGKEVAKKFLIVGVAIYAIFAPLILGALLWFVGKLVDSKAEIGQATMVATYGLFPRVLEAVVNAGQLVFLPDDAITSRYSVTLGVGRFLDANTTNPLLLAIVGRIDVFTLWVTVLYVIGLSVVGKIPISRAAVAGAIMWLIGALPGVWGALRG